MNKWLVFTALLIVGIAIGGLITYAVPMLIPSNDTKNTAYSPFVEGDVKNYEAFLKIPDIPGTSIHEMHDQEIVIEEFSWSEASDTGLGGEHGASSVEMEDFEFIFEMDPKASPKLFLACAQGQFLDNVVLTVRTIGGPKFLKITFKAVQVTSFQTLGNTYQGSHPMDVITISFSRIEFEYSEISSTGHVEANHRAWWDIPGNTGGVG